MNISGILSQIESTVSASSGLLEVAKTVGGPAVASAIGISQAVLKGVTDIKAAVDEGALIASTTDLAKLTQIQTELQALVDAQAAEIDKT